jgi:hypothetical protein
VVDSEVDRFEEIVVVLLAGEEGGKLLRFFRGFVSWRKE